MGVEAVATVGEFRVQQKRRLGLAGLFSVAVFLLFALVTMVNAISKPIANWDMIPYVGSALQRNGVTDPAEIHRQSYALVKAKVTEAQWMDLISNGRYRAVQAADPHAFVSMLPMYQVKGGYVSMVAAAARVADPVDVMRAVSVFGAAATLAGLLYAFYGLGALRLIGLTVPVLAAVELPDQASLCGPDIIATAMVVWAAALIAVRAQVCWPAVALLVVSVLFRPDMLVATVGLALALGSGSFIVALARGEPAVAALSGAIRTTGLPALMAAPLGVAAYLVAKIGVAHPGWWAHFWFSVIEQRDTMQGFAPAFDLKAYLSGLVRVFMRAMRGEAWPWIMVALAVAGVMWMRLRAFTPILAGLMLLTIGTIAARSIAFPLPDARIATPWVLIATMVLAGYLIQVSRERSGDTNGV